MKYLTHLSFFHLHFLYSFDFSYLFWTHALPSISDHSVAAKCTLRNGGVFCEEVSEHVVRHLRHFVILLLLSHESFSSFPLSSLFKQTKCPWATPSKVNQGEISHNQPTNSNSQQLTWALL